MLMDHQTTEVPLPGTEAYEEVYHQWLNTLYEPLAGGWQY